MVPAVGAITHNLRVAGAKRREEEQERYRKLKPRAKAPVAVAPKKKRKKRIKRGPIEGYPSVTRNVKGKKIKDVRRGFGGKPSKGPHPLVDAGILALSFAPIPPPIHIPGMGIAIDATRGDNAVFPRIARSKFGKAVSRGVKNITRSKANKKRSESMKATWATGRKRAGGVSKHGRTTKGRKARGKK
jgi:hypothetical protein